jgi:FkbM family methyltransferase
MKPQNFYNTSLSPSNCDPPVNLLQRSAAGLILKVRPQFFASFLKKSLGFKRTNITTSEGIFHVDLASLLGDQLLKTGVYESEMIHVLKTYLGAGDIFVDLGGNEGYFTVIASLIVGKKGKVITIEPQSRLQPIIKKNLALNNCKNVTILQTLVSDSSGIGSLYLASDLNSGATSLVSISRFSLPKEDIQTLTLTEVFHQQKIFTCDLLKVDIEGYEYEAILGSKDLFTSHRIKAIALELHPYHLAKRRLSEKDIVNFLSSCGYSLSTLSSNTVFLSPDYVSKVSKTGL